jgi:hypothetical protein
MNELMIDYSEITDDLFAGQLSEWELARNNYSQLDNVRVRKISFNGYEIAVQFNPGRITSSAAKVDTRSIEARPCFLCEKNRPPQQRGINAGNYIILINPFPIFRRHLTIVCVSHVDQRIAGHFNEMLDFAATLPEYVVFYNGPQCGASAPDHMHFQAGNKGFMPIEKDMADERLCRQVASAGGTRMFMWQNYGRGIVTVSGSDKEALSEIFSKFYARFVLTQPDRPEPMLNIIASYADSRWVIHIIPRKLHRPSCYFAEGVNRILLSPASVDIGGVLITPREEDFMKITAEDIESIFAEVCLDEKEISLLTEDIL